GGAAEAELEAELERAAQRRGRVEALAGVGDRDDEVALIDGGFELDRAFAARVSVVASVVHDLGASAREARTASRPDARSQPESGEVAGGALDRGRRRRIGTAQDVVRGPGRAAGGGTAGELVDRGDQLLDAERLAQHVGGAEADRAAHARR